MDHFDGIGSVQSDEEQVSDGWLTEGYDRTRTHARCIDRDSTESVARTGSPGAGAVVGRGDAGNWTSSVPRIIDARALALAGVEQCYIQRMSRKGAQPMLELFKRMFRHLCAETVDSMARTERRLQTDPDMQLVWSGNVSSLLDSDRQFRNEYVLAAERVQSSPFPCVMYDIRRKMLCHNKKFAEVVGYPADCLKANPYVLPIIIDMSSPFSIRTMNQILQDEGDPSVKKSAYSVAIRKSDGSVNLVMAAASFLRSTFSGFAAAICMEILPMPEGFNLVHSASSPALT
eukprot:ANDGO_01396.mRNA.1 hypothetical protein